MLRFFLRPIGVASWCALLFVTLTLGSYGTSRTGDSVQGPAGGAAPATTTRSDPAGSSPGPRTGVSPSPDPPPQLPQGGRTIFPAYRVVAYYGTAGTAALGVLGSQPPERIVERLSEAATAYDTAGRKVQIAFELIVTVADGRPGPDGDYSHHIDRSEVRDYVRAARRHDALVVLDIQPGRGDFRPAVRHWQEFLEEPNVGLALDPEWHMTSGQVPAQTIGSVGAAEVNKVSAYLSDLVRKHNLPQKLLVLHTFRESMLVDEGDIKTRPGLALVQHLDGFGSQGVKRKTYRKLREPGRFHMGFKLFYDEDIDMLTPEQVFNLEPPPEYVSYQ